MIVDVHCHAWPDAIAERAMAGRVPQLERFGDGTVGSLRQVMARAGVDNAVILGIADQARHVDGVNRFVAAQKADGFFGFGTVHPDLTVQDNLDSLHRNGIKGVKLHSLFQGFSLDDRRIWDLLDAFGSEIAVITHVGGGGSGEVNERATPRMIPGGVDDLIQPGWIEPVLQADLDRDARQRHWRIEGAAAAEFPIAAGDWRFSDRGPFHCFAVARDQRRL